MDRDNSAPNGELDVASASLSADFDDAVAFRCQVSSVCEELKLETEYKATLPFFKTLLRRVYERFRLRFTDNWMARIAQTDCEKFKDFSRTIERLLASIQAATKSLAKLSGKNRLVDIMTAFEGAQSAIQSSVNDFGEALDRATEKYCLSWREDN